MAITVGDIYTKFPSFKQEDMVSLVGSKEFDAKLNSKSAEFTFIDNKKKVVNEIASDEVPF